MKLSETIQQNPKYNAEIFSATMFFIKNWEAKHGNPDASKIDVSVRDKEISLLNNRSAVVKIDTEHLYLSVRGPKTGKITNNKYLRRENFINEALDKLFELN